MNHTATSGKLYFPNLNGLRAIGACIVMFYHIEFYRIMRGIPTFQWFPIPGKVGVALFFSLSGFLITSLLMTELETTHTIRLKSFYKRRILRIWPLYYLVLFLCFFIINRLPMFAIPGLSDHMYNDMTTAGIINALLIIPNFTHFYVPYSDQRWSITIEEVFYLMQPALIRLFQKRYLLCFVFGLIVFSSEGVGLVLAGVHAHHPLSEGVLHSITEQLKYLGCIAVGCVGSVLYFKRETAGRKVLFSLSAQVGVLVALVGCVVYSLYIRHVEEFVDLRIYCALFSVVVLNAALNPKTIFRLEYPLLDFLGKISYGIYMYHMIGIGIAFGLASLLTQNRIGQNLILYPMTIVMTVGIAWLSFRYFESYFLRLKSGKRASPVSDTAIPTPDKS